MAAIKADGIAIKQILILGLLMIIISSMVGCTTARKNVYRKEIVCTNVNIKPIIEKPNEANIDLRNHVVVVDSEGRINTPKNWIYSPYKEDKCDKFRSNFKRIITGIHEQRALNKDTQLLMYFNGGLNKPEDLLEQAHKQIPQMLEHGYYPIFMVWPTGGFDSYMEQVLRARNGRLISSKRWAAPLYVLGDLGQGIARAPINYANQFGRFRHYVEERDKDEYSVQTKKYGDYQIQSGTPINSQSNLLFSDRVDEGSIDKLDLTFYSALTPVRVITTPFIDALGKTAWENMLRRTQTTVRRPIEFNINIVRPELKEVIDKQKDDFPNGIGSFAKFFTMLETCSNPAEKQWPDERKECYKGISPEMKNTLEKTQITAIGHSMGTIVLNELIPSHPSLNYKNIVYMAAASSIRGFNQTLAPFIAARDGKTRFYNLMLHPINEARELSKGGSLPAGSLLEWIDYMFEGPKTMMDRTLGKWRNVRATKHAILPVAQQHMLFRVFDRTSLESGPANPRKHGDFNDDKMKYWCPEFWGAPSYDPTNEDWGDMKCVNSSI